MALNKYENFGWSQERIEFANDWHRDVDQFWRRQLGYICTKDELLREDMVGYYHTRNKPRLLLDTVKREVVTGDSLPGKIKYLAVSHGWPQSLNVRGVVLHGMYWSQDCIDDRALDCLIEDAWSLGFRYVWIDALCTPQKEDFDIEDVNRMREYFSECACCLVYLNGVGADVTLEDISAGNLHWFSRYWTLQEGWLPYQCIYKLSRNNETVYATDYNFYWLLAASPRLGEIEALQRGFELLGSSWWPTLSNVDRQLSGRTGYNNTDAIYSIQHLVRPLFKDPDVVSPRLTDVVELAEWFVEQLKDPQQLVGCPTILSLFGDSNVYTWLRSAPPIPMSISEAEEIIYDVIWPGNTKELLKLRQSREYPNYQAVTRDTRDLWDYRAARAIQRAMVRKSGGGNRLDPGLWEKLQRFQDAGGPDGQTVEAFLDGVVPERLALVSTHKRWPNDQMRVVRELVLVRSSTGEVYHAVGWRESILGSIPPYRRQEISIAESNGDDVPLR
ncbi:hypothetical protein BJ742DRAFT_797817 [Cladochytrium replicatum]|nr:hypothetical protein BJ742DRAFT_797817 [Cladochytrium replicatum]